MFLTNIQYIEKMPIICAGRNCGACGKNYTSRLSVFGFFFVLLLTQPWESHTQQFWHKTLKFKEQTYFYNIFCDKIWKIMLICLCTQTPETWRREIFYTFWFLSTLKIFLYFFLTLFYLKRDCKKINFSIVIRKFFFFD